MPPVVWSEPASIGAEIASPGNQLAGPPFAGNLAYSFAGIDSSGRKLHIAAERQRSGNVCASRSCQVGDVVPKSKSFRAASALSSRSHPLAASFFV